MAVKRITSGVEGLDQILKGGFPDRHQILVCGGPGTGKTLFGLQYLYMGAEKGEQGLFISLEERPASIIENAKATFGWDWDKHLGKKLTVTGIQKYNFENFSDTIQSYVEEHGAKRVVIDSATLLKLFFKSDFEYRKSLFELLDFLETLDCTVVVTSERSFTNREQAQFSIEEFVADGVIVLYSSPKGNERVRALEVLKMRGVNHKMNLVPFKITGKGLVVYTEEVL